MDNFVFTDQALPPEEWCRILHVEIMDTDGWRYVSPPLLEKDFSDKITLDEFVQRLRACTFRFNAAKIVRERLPKRNATIFYRGTGNPKDLHEIIGIKFGEGGPGTLSVGDCPEEVDGEDEDA